MNIALKTKIVGLLFAVLLAACSSNVIVYQYQYDSTLDEVFVKQGVDFSGYDSIIIDQVSVWYPDKYAPSPENLELININLARAQDMFRDSIVQALPDRFSIADAPAGNVLRLHVEFLDLRAAQDTDLPSELGEYEFKTRPGHITMTGELLDSLSGEQLARAADLGKKQSVGGNGRVDWDAIGADFEYWASVFGAWMGRSGSQN